MKRPAFDRITWAGELDQHFIPAEAAIVPGFALLCGRRGPDELRDMNGVGGQIEKPMCRRCSRSWAKIYLRWFRTDTDAFRESVERDLARLPTVSGGGSTVGL